MREGGVLKVAPACAFFHADVRAAHLQRHLSVKYIEQRRFFDKYQYNSQSTTKLPKIMALAFLLFLQRVVKMGTNAKNRTLSVLREIFRSEVRPCSKSAHQKNF